MGKSLAKHFNFYLFRNVTNDTTEKLEFRDRIIQVRLKMSLLSHEVGWRRSLQVARRAAVRQPRVRSSARAPQNMK